MTPEERRRARLAADFQEMTNLQGQLISSRAIRGTPPHVEEYEVTVRVRTIIGSRPDFIDALTVRVTLPAGYPRSAAPHIVAIDAVPFHCNWWPRSMGAHWCTGWDKRTGLGEHLVRMVRTLQFDPDPHIMNLGSRANSDAASWYTANRGRGLFPCDDSTLPDPTVDVVAIE